MIIDVEGNILDAWIRGNGVLIMDYENPYGIEFAIGVRYTEAQKNAYSGICDCKQYLKATDYKAIKYAEGEISEADYAPIKAERAKAREMIRKLEFDEPTLTKEQIAEAERKAMEKWGKTKT